MVAAIGANASQLVTIFGGSGFLGTHIVRLLARQGYRIRVAVRRPHLAVHVQPLGTVGQVMPVQANVRYPASVAHALEGSDIVINLVGVLKPTGRQTFEALQEQGAEIVATAAARAKVRRFIHVSAIGADPTSPSLYARTKAAGEASVLKIIPDAVILRPSIVFGPEDDFFNRFAGLARMLPVIPLAGADTLFQPVYVNDIARAVFAVLQGQATPGSIYELGGPEVKSFKDLVSYVLEVIGRKRLILPLPDGIASVQAGVLETLDKLSLGLLPDSLVLTRDQVTLLQKDNVVSPEAERERRTLQGLGIAPTTLESIVPTYLYRFRKAGQFSREGVVG